LSVAYLHSFSIAALLTQLHLSLSRVTVFNFLPGLLLISPGYLQTQQRRRGEESFLVFISITAKPRLLSRWVCGSFCFDHFKPSEEEKRVF